MLLKLWIVGSKVLAKVRPLRLRHAFLIIGDFQTLEILIALYLILQILYIKLALFSVLYDVIVNDLQFLLRLFILFMIMLHHFRLLILLLPVGLVGLIIL